MNFYSHHIGDHLQETAHLTALQDLAYRRLKDLYFKSESALAGEPLQIARLLRMPEYVDDVKAVLGEFFQFVDGVYRREAFESIIAEYQAKQEKNSRAGRASAQRRANGRPKDAEQSESARSTNVQHAFNDRSTTVQPTNNQEPITKNHTNTSQPAKRAPLEIPKRATKVVRGFESWWELYPNIRTRKVGKHDCLKAWRFHDLEKQSNKVIAVLKEDIASEQWQKEDGQYVPKPINWLMQRMYKRESTTPSASRPVCSVCGGTGGYTLSGRNYCQTHFMSRDRDLD